MEVAVDAHHRRSEARSASVRSAMPELMRAVDSISARGLRASRLRTWSSSSAVERLFEQRAGPIEPASTSRSVASPA